MVDDPDCCLVTLKLDAGCFDVYVTVQVSGISLPCCHHFNLNVLFLFFLFGSVEVGG